jgi:dynein heavy chain
MNALIKKEVVLENGPDQKESLKQFVPEAQWPAVLGLTKLKVFENLVSQLESEALQWKKWCGEEKAEICELPKSQKELSMFHRLLLLRALRPDRVSNAMIIYARDSMGERYVQQPAFDIEVMFKEMTLRTPGFFVLFPGVDPTPEVEFIGEKNNKRAVDGTFINISMGEGQEKPALDALKDSAKTGKWLMVQNVHLMEDWLKDFERALEVACDDDPHAEFRCFISSEPPGAGRLKELIPESILQNSIKVANEAPRDLQSNLRRAISKFDEAYYDKAKSHKYLEFKALIFGLCMFHSLILGRRKFGSMGWSKIYNFNDGDLRICGDVLHNYLAAYEKVPYEDLRYLYGEIMYGGHITDDWDRRTNNTYLEVIVKPEIMQQMQLTLHPGFKSPDPAKFERAQYCNYIEEKLPVEQPQMFGLHPNAEIGYLTNQGDTLFGTILAVQGGGGGGGAGGGDVVQQQIDQFLGTLPPDFNLLEIAARIEELSPYIIVAQQECERMNILLSTIRKTLNDLDQGLKGALNMTDAMEAIAAALRINKVPAEWEGCAYFSKKTLIEWFADLLLRVTQLAEWTEEVITPSVLWISGLFNPMSFLTAIMQVTSRAHQLPLDDICLRTDIKNSFAKEDFKTAEVGAYVTGFFFEGASWEIARGDEQGYLVDMQPKILHPECPVMHVTAIRRADRVTDAMYQCPVYVTSQRGPTFVFAADLQMESEEIPVSRWILAGVALLMSPE